MQSLARDVPSYSTQPISDTFTAGLISAVQALSEHTCTEDIDKKKNFRNNGRIILLTRLSRLL